MLVQTVGAGLSVSRKGGAGFPLFMKGGLRGIFCDLMFFLYAGYAPSYFVGLSPAFCGQLAHNIISQPNLPGMIGACGYTQTRANPTVHCFAPVNNGH